MTEHGFDRVLGTLDVLVVAFGAMIGWGWVVSTGSWIEGGGVIGTVLGFLIGGLLIYLIGLVYAELTSAMPKCGGAQVFSETALGTGWSFACTWAVILSYVGVVCFEACSVPAILQYLFPDIPALFTYRLAGHDVQLSYVFISIAMSVVIIAVNVLGTRKAAAFQTAFTVAIGVIGILLLAGGVFSGDAANVRTQAFVTTGDGALWNIAKVAIVTPFFLFGFDVIPQAAEEIRVPARRLGRLMLLSIVLAVAFYSGVVLAVGLIFSPAEIASSQGRTGLVTADAMAKAFGGTAMAKVLILGGLCGVLTSWNSFLIGGSRSIYSLAAARLLPDRFAALSPRWKTPVAGIALLGTLSVAAPFGGRVMLTWIVDAANMACCFAYAVVSVSFLVLRRTRPSMPRPFRVPAAGCVGVLALLLSLGMMLLYIIPGTQCSLIAPEWMIAGGWCALGALLFTLARVRMSA